MSAHRARLGPRAMTAEAIYGAGLLASWAVERVEALARLCDWERRRWDASHPPTSDEEEAAR